MAGDRNLGFVDNAAAYDVSDGQNEAVAKVNAGSSVNANSIN